MIIPPLTEVLPVALNTGATTIALGTTGTFKLKIQRQSRRLERIMLLVNFTIASGTATASWDGPEAMFSEVRLHVNDQKGNRNMIQATSAELYHWSRAVNGRCGRLMAGSFGQKANGTYNMILPVWVRHPLAEEPLGNSFSLPLSALYLNEDPYLELDVNSLAAVGLSAGTFTINSIYAHMLYRDFVDSPGINYIPTELVTSGLISPAASGPAKYDLPQSGWLSQIMISCYASATARGDILNTNKNLQLLYGKSVRLETNYLFAQEEGDLWSDNFPSTSTLAAAGSNTRPEGYNPTGIMDLNLWHDIPNASAYTAGSLLNQEPTASGDRAKLNIDIISGGQFRYLTHKILTANLAAASQAA